MKQEQQPRDYFVTQDGHIRDDNTGSIPSAFVLSEMVKCYSEHALLQRVAQAAESLNKRVVLSSPNGSPAQIAAEELGDALTALNQHRKDKP